MDMINVAVSFAGGILVGVIAEKLVQKMKENQKIEHTKLLEECFGEPIYASTFSLVEVRDWIKERQEIIQNGSKAIVLKVNEDTLTSIGKDLDIGNSLVNFLVIAIMNTETKEISDSLLVKYEELDQALEQALSKGNGVLVVGE